MPCSRQSHPLPTQTPQIRPTQTQIQNPQANLLPEKARPAITVVGNSILVDVLRGHLLVQGVGLGTENDLRSGQFLGPEHRLDVPRRIPVVQPLGQDTRPWTASAMKKGSRIFGSGHLRDMEGKGEVIGNEIMGIVEGNLDI